MSKEEVKKILLLYRPHLRDEGEFAEALTEARRDPELAQWLEQHLAAQTATQERFREIPVPTDLRTRILAECKPRQARTSALSVWRRQAGWLAAAASIAILIGLGGWFFSERTPDRFADCRDRVVQTVLRQYRMPVISTNREEVRQYHRSRNAPADYTLPNGLQNVSAKGGGLFLWRGHPVSMVCFERVDKELLYLFVLDRDAFKDPPRSNPELAQVNKLMTASWTSGNRTYILAAPEDSQSIRKYL